MDEGFGGEKGDGDGDGGDGGAVGRRLCKNWKWERRTLFAAAVESDSEYRVKFDRERQV